MAEFDRTGTYRGIPQDWGVSETKNGFPQFVCKLRATEYYDEENAVWLSWAEYEQEIIGYFVLFGGNGKPCLNFEQVQKALGWDGAKFSDLDTADWSNVVVQFRVEDHEYNGATQRQVTWIDAHDATPGRAIKKLDSKGLQALDAKFKGQMGAKAVTPAKVPPKPAAAPPRAADPTPAAPASTSVPGTEESAPSEDVPAPAAKPPARKPKPKPPKSKTGSGLADKCTKAEAWQTVVELALDEVDDKEKNEAWLNAAREVNADNVAEEDLTAEQWAQIRDATLDQIKHSPF